MRRQRGMAEVAGRVVVGRGDDVPSRPTRAHVVKGCELAGNVVGLREARRYRAAESDARRSPGERRQQRDRLERVHVHRKAAPGVQVVGARGGRIGDEVEIEFALLGELGDAAKVANIRRAGWVCAGMQPRGWMVAGGVVDEHGERHHAPLGHGPLLALQGRPRPARRCGLRGRRALNPAFPVRCPGTAICAAPRVGGKRAQRRAPETQVGRQARGASAALLGRTPGEGQGRADYFIDAAFADE